MHKELKADHEN
jgi:hypothetical protein